MNVLFIGNDASRTGAPIGLLHLLRWFKANTDLDFRMLLRVGGPLLAAYRALGDVVIYGDLQSDLGRPQRVARRLGFRSLAGMSCRTPVERLYGAQPPDLVYANTITVGGVLGDLAGLRCPVICHVHELESVIAKYGRRNFGQIRRHACTYVAASNAVRDNLVRRHRISPAAIEVIHESIPVPAPTSADGAAARRALGIPEEAFVVGGCGGDPFRKGVDLFVAVAQAVLESNAARPIHFLWVGGPASEQEQEQVQALFHTSGLGRVHAVGPVENPGFFFHGFDAFAMVSREDPFPFVNLEAASLGKPVLCFRGTGGSEEFVESDAGICVPYLDVQAMASAVLQLAADPERTERLGRGAAAKIRARHSVAEAGPRVEALIRTVAAGTDGWMKTRRFRNGQERA